MEDHRCPPLLSERRNNTEKPDIQPTPPGAKESNIWEFMQNAETMINQTGKLKKDFN